MTTQQQILIAGTLDLIIESLRMFRVGMVQLESSLRRMRDILLEDARQ